MRYALAAVAMLFRIEDRSDGEFRVVRTAAEIERCLDEEVWRVDPLKSATAHRMVDLLVPGGPSRSKSRPAPRVARRS